MKNKSIMINISLMLSLLVLIILTSCSEDISGADDNKNISGLKWKKDKYNTCEIQIGYHTYIYDVAKGDTVEIRGNKLFLYHSNRPYSQYRYQGDYGRANIYLDFDSYSITFMEYWYDIYDSQTAAAMTGRMGYNNDQYFAARLLNLPFTISKDGTITASIIGNQLKDKFIYNTLIRHNDVTNNNPGGQGSSSTTVENFITDSLTVFMMVVK